MVLNSFRFSFSSGGVPESGIIPGDHGHFFSASNVGKRISSSTLPVLSVIVRFYTDTFLKS